MDKAPFTATANYLACFSVGKTQSLAVALRKEDPRYLLGGIAMPWGGRLAHLWGSPSPFRGRPRARVHLRSRAEA